MSRIPVQATSGHSASSRSGRGKSPVAAAAAVDVVPGQFSELDW